MTAPDTGFSVNRLVAYPFGRHESNGTATAIRQVQREDIAAAHILLTYRNMLGFWAASAASS